MSRLLALAAVPLSALALVVAGCGGDDGGNAATDWAGDVCTAISTWTDSIGDAVNSVQGTGLSRDAVESAADDARAATETFVDELKGLGAPDTESGEEARDTVEQLADEIEQELDALQENVSSASGIVDAVTAVTSTLSAMSDQLTATLNELEQLDVQGELEDAFEQAPACDELGA
jgi:ABC-type transporter Mla subunit MlaD